jgi:thymidylate synthase (FAD)
MTKTDLLGLYFPVLDYGFVSLVDVMGDDAAIAQAARCSYGAGTKKSTNNRHLIRHLAREKHTSPFEQAEIKLHCRMPIFVARQWIRHRMVSVNEASGRYSIMPLQFYTPQNNVVSAQSLLNKQGRDQSLSPEVINSYQNNLAKVRKVSTDMYISALKDDVARELARIDLPLFTYTEWYWKIDLHNLLHFLGLRCDKHAQYEIREYANVIAGMVKYLFPMAYEAWQDYSFGAKTYSRMECILLHEEISGQIATQDRAKELGMTDREWVEFQDKLNYDGVVQNFPLDLSSAKTAEYFEKQAESFVPVI